MYIYFCYNKWFKNITVVGHVRHVGYNYVKINYILLIQKVEIIFIQICEACRMIKYA